MKPIHIIQSCPGASQWTFWSLQFLSRVCSSTTLASELALSSELGGGTQVVNIWVLGVRPTDILVRLSAHTGLVCRQGVSHRGTGEKLAHNWQCTLDGLWFWKAYSFSLLRIISGLNCRTEMSPLFCQTKSVLVECYLIHIFQIVDRASNSLEIVQTFKSVFWLTSVAFNSIQGSTVCFESFLECGRAHK